MPQCQRQPYCGWFKSYAAAKMCMTCCGILMSGPADKALGGSAACSCQNKSFTGLHVMLIGGPVDKALGDSARPRQYIFKVRGTACAVGPIQRSHSPWTEIRLVAMLRHTIFVVPMTSECSVAAGRLNGYAETSLPCKT